MWTMKKAKKKVTKGCFGYSGLYNEDGSYAERKTDPLNWREGKIPSGKTWKPKPIKNRVK